MFGIIFYDPKNTENVGTALRSAYLYNADVFIIIGQREHVQRVLKQGSNTYKAHHHIPTLFFNSWEQFQESFSRDGVKLVAIELATSSISLPSFQHPKNAMYVFGNERNGIPKDVLSQCDHIVQIPAVRPPGSFNLSTACSITLYDRFAKL